MLTLERFKNLCRRLMPHPPADEAAERLAFAHSDLARSYHGKSHIADCLEQFDSVRGHFEHPDDAEFALWYHDIVYDSRAKDNEARSADWAAKELEFGGADTETIARVRKFIDATRHVEMPADCDARLIVDIDLSTLGRDAKIFDAYDAAIRKEYAWVPDEQYRAGRAAVLRTFLKRERIYFSDYFFERFEKQARENLERAIERLIRTMPCGAPSRH
jgi:predicted metal-dependent HD superfamily phosphohydrolase